MEVMEAIRARHSVRAYTDQPIAADLQAELQKSIEQINDESGLHIQLVIDEPQAFSGMMARYGGFKGVRSYIALIGKKSPALDEACGYWGEHLVLRAQQLGLNTCWVGLTYKKIPSAIEVLPGEKLVIVVALGHGQSEGSARKSKRPGQVSSVITEDGSVPVWFENAIDAALLAPTAMNQQKFHFTLTDKGVVATKGTGFYTACDLGIAKYHFEVGAAPHKVDWL